MLLLLLSLFQDDRCIGSSGKDGFIVREDTSSINGIVGSYIAAYSRRCVGGPRNFDAVEQFFGPLGHKQVTDFTIGQVLEIQGCFGIVFFGSSSAAIG